LRTRTRVCYIKAVKSLEPSKRDIYPAGASRARTEKGPRLFCCLNLPIDEFCIFIYNFYFAKTLSASRSGLSVNPPRLTIDMVILVGPSKWGREK
jgi:hypothetical protein